MASLVFSYLTWRRPIGYALIFLGMMFEGDIVLFTASFLTHQGFFDAGDMLVVASAGMLMGDTLWYYAGSRFGQRARSAAGRWIERIARPFDAHIAKRPFRTVFISKFAYGMHHALLARAGMIGLPPRTFFKNDAIASILWMLIVGGLGFTASASFVSLKHYFRFAEIVVAAGIFLIFCLEYAIARRSQKFL